MTIAVLFGIAVVTRILYLAAFYAPFEGSFVAIAEMFAGTTAADAEALGRFEPGYPAFIASGLLLFGERLIAVRLLQVCVAAAGAALLYALATKLTSSRFVGLLASLLYGIHPLLVRQASAPSDLALVSTLLVGFCLAFVRIRDRRTAAFAGLWLGTAIVTRSMTLPLLVFAVLLLLRERQIGNAVSLALGTATLLVPMVAYNVSSTGVPWPTRSGINLYIGNSPYTSALLPAYDLDLLEENAYQRFLRTGPTARSSSPGQNAEFDFFLTKAAVDHIWRDPSGALWQKTLNIGYQLSPRITPFYVSDSDTRVIIDQQGSARVVGSAPRPPIQVWSYAISRTLLLVGSVFGIWHRRQMLGRDAVLWAVVVTFISVNAVYVPASRYTAPMVFVMMFYTAVAVSGVSVLLRSRSAVVPGVDRRGLQDNIAST